MDQRLLSVARHCYAQAMHALAHLAFTRMPPSPAFAGLVQCYWQLWHPQPLPLGVVAELMHPEGGTGIVFNFGAPLAFNGVACHAPCLLCGPATRTAELTLSGAVNLFGVRFLAGAGLPFLQLPMHELAMQRLSSQEVGLDDAWQPLQALSPTDMPARVGFIERWLQTRWQRQEMPRSDVVTALSYLAHADTRQPISDVLADIALGGRQIERLFQHWVGLAPKQLARFYRVAQVRRHVKCAPDTTLTTIAHANGYCDQAHMTHDFKAVVGFTPGRYRQRVRQHVSGGAERPAPPLR
ncbi:MAG TPA: hypothetical protein DD979_09135 [Gammaproteobacteria bacterium]|nr:hypothetical protein [Gammaproteobacteria bacterium]